MQAHSVSCIEVSLTDRVALAQCREWLRAFHLVEDRVCFFYASREDPSACSSVAASAQSPVSSPGSNRVASAPVNTAAPHRPVVGMASAILLW